MKEGARIRTREELDIIARRMKGRVKEFNEKAEKGIKSRKERVDNFCKSKQPYL